MCMCVYVCIRMTSQERNCQKRQVHLQRSFTGGEGDAAGMACVAVCCSVLQCVAVCCSVLQCVAMCCHVLPCVAVRCSVTIDVW